jgi:putative ABC transport system ATP-binding protein
MVMQVIAATVLLALGGYLVIQGSLTLGQLVAAELIVTVILGSFAKIGKDLESFYDLMASVDKLGKLFDLPVERSDKLQIARRPGAYSLSLVDMKLDAKSVPKVNVEFLSGRTYAIYGASELHRGKLIDVMVGQSIPSSGYVLLDDFRVDAISAESLQEKISLIREIELFDGTVDDNLRMGREDFSSAQVNDVTTRLGLQQTLAGLPHGWNTHLNIGGYPLTQNQASRLVLARALVSRPGILFIDGLLDRLSDDDTEEVLKILSTFSADITIIVTTGRRVIARWADRVMDLNGETWALANYSD